MLPEQQTALVELRRWHLPREGANVVVADVSEQGNQETARTIEELGGQAIALRCDVTRAEDVKAALDKTIETFVGGWTLPSTMLVWSRRIQQQQKSKSKSGIGS